MTKSRRLYLTISILLSFASMTSFAQVTNLSIDDVYEAYRDSLKETPYPWRLPVMGAKVRKLGFDIPYPNGVMLAYALSRQQLTVDNLEVNFNPDNLINVDGLARFQSIVANVNAYTARYDFWLLPFMNLSVIGGKVNSVTDVHLGLPFDLKFSVNTPGTTVGWGSVVAGGVGPMVMSGDFTMAWTWTPNTDRPNATVILGGRVGYMLRFKRRPDRNLVFLVGGQYLRLNPYSTGKADLENLVGITPEKKQNALEQLNAWYGDLTSREQEVLAPIYDGLSGWLSRDESTFIYYSFNKRLYYPWSLSAGVNFQINHRYQLTGMYSFLGSREQIVLGLTYRFGWKGKNVLSGFTL